MLGPACCLRAANFTCWTKLFPSTFRRHMERGLQCLISVMIVGLYNIYDLAYSIVM